MYDYPHGYSIGARDVIAAWLLCLAIAGALFIYPPVAAGSADPIAHARAVPRAMPAAICAVSRSLAEISRS
jgi:hypothetical protein